MICDTDTYPNRKVVQNILNNLRLASFTIIVNFIATGTNPHAREINQCKPMRIWIRNFGKKKYDHEKRKKRRGQKTKSQEKLMISP
jgi:hypothetical protein